MGTRARAPHLSAVMQMGHSVMPRTIACTSRVGTNNMVTARVMPARTRAAPARAPPARTAASIVAQSSMVMVGPGAGTTPIASVLLQHYRAGVRRPRHQPNTRRTRTVAPGPAFSAMTRAWASMMFRLFSTCLHTARRAPVRPPAPHVAQSARGYGCASAQRTGPGGQTVGPARPRVASQPFPSCCQRSQACGGGRHTGFQCHEPRIRRPSQSRPPRRLTYRLAKKARRNVGSPPPAAYSCGKQA